MSITEATTVYRYDYKLRCWYCTKCETCHSNPKAGETCHCCGRIITWVESKEVR